MSEELTDNERNYLINLLWRELKRYRKGQVSLKRKFGEDYDPRPYIEKRHLIFDIIHKLMPDITPNLREGLRKELAKRWDGTEKELNETVAELEETARRIGRDMRDQQRRKELEEGKVRYE